MNKRINPAIQSFGGGLAAWSIRHPVGVIMISLAVVVLGSFALGALKVDLLPQIIYPEVRVRVIDPGVPATIMEDRITRQLEEQLAITENATHVQSESNEGRSSVFLSFAYGTDINRAYRDASIRLDRAKRFLPDTIDPPIIYKRDPSQRPVFEMVVASPLRDPIELRSWVDYDFTRWFLTLPGVAAAEVGGGLIREIQVQPDLQRLQAAGLGLQDIRDALSAGNLDQAGGSLLSSTYEVNSRTQGRFKSVDAIARLPLTSKSGAPLHLRDVASIIDTHETNRLRVRANGLAGVKLSIQKQPTANTVSVVDEVKARIKTLQDKNLLPDDIEIHRVADQAVFIRHALRNAAMAATSGAILAMLVVFIFLGSIRRSLIIGTAIPFALMVTFILMQINGLTLNIMSLGGLALGVGLLIDNTIVMLDNIARHQREGDDPKVAPVHAAAEINSALVASTSTNLSAILPFLFVGGLVGLLYKELIFTIAVAMLASLLVSLTLVPAMGSRIQSQRSSRFRHAIDRFMEKMQRIYASALVKLNNRNWLVVLVMLGLLALAAFLLNKQPQAFLPEPDDGRIYLRITSDPGTPLHEMDKMVAQIEKDLLSQPEVVTVFTQVGGYVFGRTEYLSSNRSSLFVQLVPGSERKLSSKAWSKRMHQRIEKMNLAGLQARIRPAKQPGIRHNRCDEGLCLRLQGDDQNTLSKLADRLTDEIEQIKGLTNVKHSAEEVRQELGIHIDRERIRTLGLDIEDVAQIVQTALRGAVVSDYLENDRSYDIRLKLPEQDMQQVQAIQSIRLFPRNASTQAVQLGDVARLELEPTPSRIKRDQQRRIVEISASLGEDIDLREVLEDVAAITTQFELPPGYSIYDAGTSKTLDQNRNMGAILLGLALFLVFVVMAVQYESLLNPLVILLGIPFTLIGVAIGLWATATPLSMPVWLGLIMLAGIVVNNAIVLVETIEIARREGLNMADATLKAARLRLRPILMTTLTTMFGMLPLALGLGQGSEMLQPLAIVITWGLGFSLLVSLLMVPTIYRILHTFHLSLSIRKPDAQPAQ